MADLSTSKKNFEGHGVQKQSLLHKDTSFV